MDTVPPLRILVVAYVCFLRMSHQYDPRPDSGNPGVFLGNDPRRYSTVLVRAVHPNWSLSIRTSVIEPASFAVLGGLRLCAL
ncbi:hypothetical protein EI94DRAFT_1716548 [Lactarius quietus]|nr:hypothetical protein EI94DRAFT_1716548 [Lactarius quietus]